MLSLPGIDRKRYEAWSRGPSLHWGVRFARRALCVRMAGTVGMSMAAGCGSVGVGARAVV